MGDPKKPKNKFSKPSHPWQKDRIDEEKELTREYGFKNKKEIWKLRAKLRNFLMQTKKLTAFKTEQSEKEKVQLLNKLRSLSLLSENAGLDDVLGLNVKDLLERRLQSLVFRKDLAKSMKQARQFITHGHIMVNNKKITSPNYLVSKEQENLISFSNRSSFIDEMHPERAKTEQKTADKKKEEKYKKGDKRPKKDYKKNKFDKKMKQGAKKGGK